MSKSKPRQPESVVARALAQDRLGVFPVVAIVGGAIAPLTVVAGGATTGYAVTGLLGIPLAYLLVAAILIVFSVGYVAMARKIVNAGAFYTYISKGLGRVVGVGASFVAILGYNTMQIGLYGGFGAVAAPFVADMFGVQVPWWGYALIAWALVAVLGVRAIDLVGRILAVLLIAEVAFTVVAAVVEFAHPAGGHVSFAPVAPHLVLSAGFGAALVLTVTGFVGFEGGPNYAEESKDPRRTVPRATYIALIFIGLIYGGASWAMPVAAGPDRIVARSQSDGTELMFNLIKPFVSSVVIDLGHALFLTSLFAALLAFHNTAARYFFALGREGVLPSRLARTSPRTHAPVAASLTQTAFGFAVIALYAVQGWDPLVKLFFWITCTGGLGVLLLMTLSSLAVLVFFARGENRAGVGVARGIIAPVAATLLLSWMLWQTLAQFNVLLGVEPSSPWRWILPGSYAVAAILGMAWAGILSKAKPDVYAEIGAGAPSVSAAAARGLEPAGISGGR